MLSQYRFVISIPDFFRDLLSRLAQLLGGSFRVRVDPPPHCHIHQTYSHNLVHGPKLVQYLVRVVDAIPHLTIRQELEIAMLPEECRSLRIGGIRHAGEHVMINKIHIKHLLHTMAKLMHGDVIPLIIHAVIRYPGAQARIFFTSKSRPCVSGAAGRLYYDMMRYTAGVFGIKSHLGQQPLHVCCKSNGIGIQFACLRTQVVLIQARTGFESVIPYIVRPQVTLQTLFDDGSYLRYLLRSHQRTEETV